MPGPVARGLAECLGQEPEACRPIRWIGRNRRATNGFGAPRRHLIATVPAEAQATCLFSDAQQAVAKHLGIVGQRGSASFIHAYSGHAVLESPLSRRWRRRVVAVSNFPRRCLMATILLSAQALRLAALSGDVAGLVIGGVGALCGQRWPALIDQRYGAGSDVCENGQVERFRLTERGRGRPVAQVYGRMRVAGHVIWATEFRETYHFRWRQGRRPPAKTSAVTVIR